MIKINALNKFYNKNRSNELHVLNGISLELPDSGMVAVFGRSGCGKTTLLNAIGGLDKTDSGEILIDGEKISDTNDKLRNKRIGYIFQNYNLNNSVSCFDNVADALRLCGITDANIIKIRTLAALRNVGMENYKLRTPDTLSGGQMQRIAIARAIVKNPRIILADEPTGNLDEANTVMIMDLLKQISKSHLVILVTHEANLVDHYCDRVIELSDGKTVGEKVNENALGYSVKSKNDIYLGELEQTVLEDETLCIEKYGDGALPSLKLRIISYQGKTYLSVDTPGVAVLDQTSEIKLREGVYHSERTANELSGDIDMSELPPLEASSDKYYGRLFGLKSSLKSGFEASFPKKKKRTQKIMRGCMLLFAFVIVFISSLQGTVFRDYFDAKSQYCGNVFYVYTPNYSVGDRLLSSLGSHGIDYMRISQYKYSEEGDWLIFSTVKFETYNAPTVSANGTLLPHSLLKDAKLVSGSLDAPSDKEIIISTLSADKVLESSSLNFARDYDDLIGFMARTMYGTFTVKGIIDSSEPIAYVSNNVAADIGFYGVYDSVDRGSKYGYTVENGKTQLIINNMTEIPALGKEITIYGRDYELSEILDCRQYAYYRTYLEAMGHDEDILAEHDNYYHICREKVKKENPGLPNDKIEERAYELYCATYYEMLERYYAHIDEYIEKVSTLYGNDFYRWLYLEKGIEIAKYLSVGEYEFVYAYDYKETYGSYPNYKEGTDSFEIDEAYNNIIRKLEAYKNEFYSSGNSEAFIGDYVYLLSDEDYIKASSALGTCSQGVQFADEYEYYKSSNTGSDVYFSTSYTMLYSSDPEATLSYITSEFSELTTPYDNYKPIVSSDILLEEYLKYQKEEMLVSLITLVVFIGVLSLCVFIIMRSALMERIKEVGIYRAIGVSRKNLIFRFFIESVVLTTLTVFIGYLISSFIISSWIASSSLIAEVFYYPAWMSLTVLIIIYSVCIASGLIPIFSLLRKTPSEILAKYDI